MLLAGSRAKCCSSRRDSALIATPTLQKLTGRFSVPVALSDTDVETVVREVVLRKKPEHVSALKSTLDSVSGEIDKHLGGTQLAPKAADKPDLVPDYHCCPLAAGSGRWPCGRSTRPARAASSHPAPHGP